MSEFIDDRNRTDMKRAISHMEIFISKNNRRFVAICKNYVMYNDCTFDKEYNISCLRKGIYE